MDFLKGAFGEMIKKQAFGRIVSHMKETKLNHIILTATDSGELKTTEVQESMALVSHKWAMDAHRDTFLFRLLRAELKNEHSQYLTAEERQKVAAMINELNECNPDQKTT
jgi:hypothetical protein